MTAFLDFLDRYKDALLLLFTIGLVVATYFLYLATRDLVKGADANAEKQLRAYVVLVSGYVQIRNLTKGGQGVEVIVELKNTGQTPAYDFTTWIKPPQILDPSATPFDAATPIDKRTGASIIGPGANAQLKWVIPASPTEVAEIASNTKRVFVWGGADYRDIFNKRRFFKFRDTNALFYVSGETVNLQPHPSGYEAN
jgi:hypothetical protein